MDLQTNKTYSKFYASYPGNYKILTRGRKAYFRDLLFYITVDDTIIESTTGKKLPIKYNNDLELEDYLNTFYELIINKINQSELIINATEITLEEFYK